MFPYSWSLTKESKKPSSEGRSERLLFDRSKVLSFLSLKMSPEILFSLLSFRISTVRLGHRSKSSNYLSPLKERAIVSSFYECGISEKSKSLFYLSSKAIRLFVFEKVPFSICSIQFLLRIRVYSFEQSLKVFIKSWLIKLLEAYTFFVLYPRAGKAFKRLSFIINI